MLYLITVVVPKIALISALLSKGVAAIVNSRKPQSRVLNNCVPFKQTCWNLKTGSDTPQNVEWWQPRPILTFKREEESFSMLSVYCRRVGHWVTPEKFLELWEQFANIGFPGNLANHWRVKARKQGLWWLSPFLPCCGVTVNVAGCCDDNIQHSSFRRILHLAVQVGT